MNMLRSQTYITKLNMQIGLSKSHKTNFAFINS
jgi:hypothetical protein